MFRTLSRLHLSTSSFQRQMSTLGKGTFAELKSESDYREVLKSSHPVLLDFSAKWCGPCHMMAPVLAELAKENPNMHFVKIDIDEFPQLANEHVVTSIPRVEIHKNGKFVAGFNGAQSKNAVQSFINQHKIICIDEHLEE